MPASLSIEWQVWNWEPTTSSWYTHLQERAGRRLPVLIALSRNCLFKLRFCFAGGVGGVCPRQGFALYLRPALDSSWPSYFQCQVQALEAWAPGTAISTSVQQSCQSGCVFQSETRARLLRAIPSFPGTRYTLHLRTGREKKPKLGQPWGSVLQSTAVVGIGLISSEIGEAISMPFSHNLTLRTERFPRLNVTHPLEAPEFEQSAPKYKVMAFSGGGACLEAAQWACLLPAHTLLPGCSSSITNLPGLWLWWPWSLLASLALRSSFF